MGRDSQARRPPDSDLNIVSLISHDLVIRFPPNHFQRVNMTYVYPFTEAIEL